MSLACHPAREKVGKYISATCHRKLTENTEINVIFTAAHMYSTYTPVRAPCQFELMHVDSRYSLILFLFPLLDMLWKTKLTRGKFFSGFLAINFSIYFQLWSSCDGRCNHLSGAGDCATDWQLWSRKGGVILELRGRGSPHEINDGGYYSSFSFAIILFLFKT